MTIALGIILLGFVAVVYLAGWICAVAVLAAGIFVGLAFVAASR